MNKPNISIVLPSIRPERLEEIYDSILKSTKRDFELIIVGPNALSERLQKLRNVKYVKDFGSPMRASCIGAMLCEGKYVYPTMSDDAYFLPNAIDQNLELLESMGSGIENVIITKYSESEGFSAKDRFQPDDYYKLCNAYPVNTEYVPKDWWIFNAFVCHREYFDKFGGWDCIFQACPMGHADLAIRMQNAGAVVNISKYPITMLDHEPGTSGTHAPIHYAQILDDTPIFQQRYNGQLSDNNKIELMNWKKAQTVWGKRFN
jgi:glycosyltransferase involved in cell wall biosynthesis